MNAPGSTPQRSLKVAMLHPCYWPEVTRGTERFMHDLGVRLARQGHRPLLITSHPGAGSTSVEDGIEVVRLHRPRGRRLQLGLRDIYLTHVPAMLSALREARPDLVHAFYPVDAAAASRWARRHDLPMVFTLMGMPRPDSIRRPVWRRIVARALTKPEVSVCLSNRAAELTRDAFGLEPRVIHLGVDVEEFQPAAARASVPTILCPADLNDVRKRGPLVRAAFVALRSKHPDARLVLSRRSAPSAQAHDEPGVEYADLDDHGTLVHAYSEAWATVLLSEAEAFGLVLTESLACGTPVVASPGGGADDIVSDGVGRLVESQDPTVVAGAIAETMDDGEAIRAACLARARMFSADRNAAAYEELYAEFLGAANPRR